MGVKQKTFLDGFKVTLPLISGVLPFGILYATIAAKAGFPPWLTLFTSIVVFGGSSQLVFIDLYQSLQSALQAVLGSNIVNARHLIYSAGLSSHFIHYPLKWRLLLSYLMTDQLYAVAEIHQKKIESYSSSDQPWFYFGSGFCTWSSWVFATTIGIYFGQIVPANWNLGFAVPLMFLPLVFMTSTNLYAYLSVVLSAVFVFVFYDLPYGLGVLLAIVLGAYVGFKLQRFIGTKQ